MAFWAAMLVCIHFKPKGKECLECGTGEREYFRWGKLNEARNLALGNCTMCGDPRGNSGYKRLCWKCGKKTTIAARKNRRWRKWKPGSRGRPPLKWVAEQAELAKLQERERDAASGSDVFVQGEVRECGEGGAGEPGAA